MPPALYNCRTGENYVSKEAMMKERKQRDNVSQKIKYWRKVYGYDLKRDDYTEFSKRVPVIRHIYKLHDFVCNLDVNNIGAKDLDTYATYHQKIKKALPIQKYLKSLKRLGQEPEKPNPLILNF